MMIKRLPVLLFLIGFTALPVLAQDEEAEPAEEGITFETVTSQTSAWPGDRFHYTITLSVPKEMRVALEDFDETNVSFEPFILDGKTQTEKDLGDRIQYEIDYLLANYEIGDQQVEIPGLIFRYEHQGPATANAPSTSEMQIPPAPFAVRTTLNQPVQDSWIRETLPRSEGPTPGWGVVLAGLAGLAVSTLPLGAWVWKQIPDWQARRRQLNRKQFLQKCLDSIRQLERDAANNGDAIKDHYEELQKVIREYTAYFWDVDAKGLTHTELSEKLRMDEASPRESEVLAAVVEHGQNCLYARQASGWREIFQEDLNEVRRLCG